MIVGVGLGCGPELPDGPEQALPIYLILQSERSNIKCSWSIRIRPNASECPVCLQSWILGWSCRYQWQCHKYKRKLAMPYTSSTMPSADKMRGEVPDVIQANSRHARHLKSVCDP
jgi:hypothetical protein